MVNISTRALKGQYILKKSWIGLYIETALQSISSLEIHLLANRQGQPESCLSRLKNDETRGSVMDDTLLRQTEDWFVKEIRPEDEAV